MKKQLERDLKLYNKVVSLKKHEYQIDEWLYKDRFREATNAIIGKQKTLQNLKNNIKKDEQLPGRSEITKML